MKPGLLVAYLTMRDVVTRAQNEFAAMVAEGPDDMTVPQVVDVAAVLSGRPPIDPLWQ